MDLRKELRRLNQYSQQAVLLTQNRIETAGQLQEYLTELDKKVHSINKEKWYLKRELTQIPPEAQAKVQEKIVSLEQEARPLIREKFLCRDILKRCSIVQGQVDREKEEAIQQVVSLKQYHKERG